MVPISVAETANPLDPSSRTFEEREAELREIKEREEEHKSTYRSWFQMNKEHTKDVLMLSRYHPKALTILYFLFDEMDNFNALTCSYRVLEEALELSRSTITRSLNVLVKNGFIHIEKYGTNNVYIVNDELVWSTWGNNRKYCKFPANIILSANDNNERPTMVKK